MKKNIELKEVVLDQKEYNRLNKLVEDIEKIRESKIIEKQEWYPGYGNESRINYEYHGEGYIKKIFVNYKKLEKQNKELNNRNNNLQSQNEEMEKRDIKSMLIFFIMGLSLGGLLSYIIF